MSLQSDALAYQMRISGSGITIYDEIKIGDPKFWIPVPELEYLLNKGLVGMSVKGLPVASQITDGTIVSLERRHLEVAVF